MKFYNNFINKTKHLSHLEKFLILIILVLIILFLKNFSYKENFESKTNEYKYFEGDKIFNNNYIDIYDLIFFDEKKNKIEIEIINTNKKIKDTSFVLDIGCGTGHHTNEFSKLSKNVLGVDISQNMVNKAKQNYPHCNFEIKNILKSLEFENNSFSHITCLYFTIYYINNKKMFFENCHSWLKFEGILVVHVVEPLKFNANVSDLKSNEKINDSNINNHLFSYKSNFKIDEKNLNNIILSKPNGNFKETIKFKKTNELIINEHKLYFIHPNKISDIAINSGFELINISNIPNKEYQYHYLYIFKKS